MTPAELIAFEQRVIDAFEAKRIRAPIHLSGGNEERLIDIFNCIKPTDWIFSTYRSHYHALLHGIDPERVFAEILAGRSMNLCFPDHRFYTSAIVGGCLPIATGVAGGIKRAGGDATVWCFVGDMAGTTGATWEAQSYKQGKGLPLNVVVEDNGMSCDTPTFLAWNEWGEQTFDQGIRYRYQRTHPHVGTGKYVTF